MTRRALIVDDERLARNELRALLAVHPSVVVVAEAATVPTAAALLAKAGVDLVFLDIELAAQSGFELLPAIGDRCEVIFVTAFDSYAVRAFEVNALDYLLKPVHPARLAAALGRLEMPSERRPPSGRLPWDGVAFLRCGASASFVEVRVIACILAEGDYSRVVTTAGKEHLVLRSLGDWEQLLPVSKFARVHRSAIANLGVVTRAARGRDGRWRLHLPALARPLIVSRRLAQKTTRNSWGESES